MSYHSNPSIYRITVQMPGASPSPDQLKALESVTYEADGVGYKIAQMVPGHGLYAGLWQPGNLLRSEINLFYAFAAPEDLRHSKEQYWYEEQYTLFTYREAVKEIANRRNWHGHDGFDMLNERDLYAGLRDQTAFGLWIVPPRELLDSRISNETREWIIPGLQSLSSLRGRGDFKETVCIDEGSYVSHYPDWYYSCTLSGYYTKPCGEHLAETIIVRPRDGAATGSSISNHKKRVRPFRVEPVRPDTMWQLASQGVLTWTSQP